jgi:hypothetical protein
MAENKLIPLTMLSHNCGAGDVSFIRMMRMTATVGKHPKIKVKNLYRPV